MAIAALLRGAAYLGGLPAQVWQVATLRPRMHKVWAGSEMVMEEEEEEERRGLADMG